MRLASLANGTRDGRLVVVDKAGTQCVRAEGIARCLQAALDEWPQKEPQLQRIAERLAAGEIEPEPLSTSDVLAPLPRAYEWLDGSAFLSHVELVRRARGAALPENLHSDPLVYQGGSGVLLPATSPVRLLDADWGLDFESELCVILDDVPQGVGARDALTHIKLVAAVNDWTYRNLVPTELAKGFGFLSAKPPTAFSPFAVTPDELGSAWRDGKLHAEVHCTYNSLTIGTLDASQMHFSFGDLIAHIAKSRPLTAGTIVGSGTVSNADDSAGIGCLAELRVRQQLAGNRALSPFMKVGDTIRIEVYSAEGDSLFGAIEQRVIAADPTEETH